jgi:hypothetical protein
MTQLSKQNLKSKVISVLKKQGYKMNSGGFVLKNDTRETKRSAHVLAKTERMNSNESFILKNIPLIQ